MQELDSWSTVICMSCDFIHQCFMKVHFLGLEITFESMLYVADEGDGFVNLTVLLDQPSCHDVTVVVVPQEQSPVDASSEN